MLKAAEESEYLTGAAAILRTVGRSVNKSGVLNELHVDQKRLVGHFG